LNEAGGDSGGGWGEVKILVWMIGIVDGLAWIKLEFEGNRENVARQKLIGLNLVSQDTFCGKSSLKALRLRGLRDLISRKLNQIHWILMFWTAIDLERLMFHLIFGSSIENSGSSKRFQSKKLFLWSFSLRAIFNNFFDASLTTMNDSSSLIESTKRIGW
jgi:hypothetical protein